MAKQTMDNIAHTGSIDFGSSTMYGSRDRKGGSVMSNRHSTSDMSGMDDIIGMADIIGAEPSQGVSLMTDSKKAKDEKDQKHAVAAIKIDARIEKLLKPEYASAYASAATTKSKDKYLDNTLAVLFGLASDDGVGGMVKSVADVDTEFGGMAFFQRAMVRRLKERSSYMNRGWFARLFADEKRIDDFTTDEFKKFLDKVVPSDRKGSSELANKDKASTLPSTMPTLPKVEVVGPSVSVPDKSNAPIPFVSSPVQTTQGMRLGKNPMGNAAVTGAEIYVGSLSGQRAEAMGNSAVTGADLALGSCSYTGAEHAEAAVAIDERIAGVLKPYWSALYRVATLGDATERKCAANSLMVAMLSEQGLPSMVKSTQAVESQFKNVGLLQRAMARRIRECCTWALR